MKPPKKDEPGYLHRLPSGKIITVSGEAAQAQNPAVAAFFANYSEYAKTLRAWLVAYGIGGPVLFLTNKDLLSVLKISVYRNCVIDLFLIGVALQVSLAFINKWCAWHMYVGEYEESFQNEKSYKMWAWLNERNWIDMTFDGLSLVSFAISTLIVVHIYS